MQLLVVVVEVVVEVEVVVVEAEVAVDAIVLLAVGRDQLSEFVAVVTRAPVALRPEHTKVVVPIEMKMDTQPIPLAHMERHWQRNCVRLAVAFVCESWNTRTDASSALA